MHGLLSFKTLPILEVNIMKYRLYLIFGIILGTITMAVNAAEKSVIGVFVGFATISYSAYQLVYNLKD
jgi:hypothetical protein